MFRTRKEDSLFDTDVDVLDAPEESATVISAPAAANNAAPASQGYTAPAASAPAAPQ